MKSIVADVLREMERGVSARECALRYGIATPTIYRYRNGTRGGRHGRPRKLSPTQELVCVECWSHGEATVYELAAIYLVTPQTMRNVLRRQLAAIAQSEG